MKLINQDKMITVQGGKSFLQCGMITVAAGVTTTVTVGGGAFLFGFAAACWAGYLSN